MVCRVRWGAPIGQVLAAAILTDYSRFGDDVHESAPTRVRDCNTDDDDYSMERNGHMHALDRMMLCESMLKFYVKGSL
jgi:hypothetical protein